MKIKVLVAYTDCGGNGPGIDVVVIECTRTEYDDGVHYDAAKDWAVEQGYEGPFIAIDQYDNNMASAAIGEVGQHASTYRTVGIQTGV